MKILACRRWSNTYTHFHKINNNLRAASVIDSNTASKLYSIYALEFNWNIADRQKSCFLGSHLPDYLHDSAFSCRHCHSNLPRFEPASSAAAECPFQQTSPAPISGNTKNIGKFEIFPAEYRRQTAGNNRFRQCLLYAEKTLHF